MTFMKWIIGFIMCLFSLLACTVDHSSPDLGVESSEDAYITGRVLAGGAVHGTVTLKNGPILGEITVDIQPDGNYTIPLIDMWTGPYILQARGTIGGRYVCLHSLGTRADVSDTVNITPLTNLVAGHVVGKNPEEYYADISSPKMETAVTQENLILNEELVRKRFYIMLKRVGIDPDNYNLLNTPIDDILHTKIDALFDFLRIKSNHDGEGNFLDSMSIATVLDQENPVIDDLTDNSSDSPMLTLPDEFEAVIQALRDIVDLFEYWEDLFETSLPKVDDANLKSIFSDDFLYNGYGLNSEENGPKGFLEVICGMSNMQKMQITGVALDSIDLTSETANVSFTVINDDDREQSYYGWKMEHTVTGWKTSGNQQIMSIHVRPYVGFNSSESEVLEFKEKEEIIGSNGLVIYAYIPVTGAADSVDYIEVTGPGIDGSLKLDRFNDLSLNELFHDGYDDDPDNIIVFANKPEDKFCPDGFYEPVNGSGEPNPLVVIDNSEYIFKLFHSEESIAFAEYTTVLKRGNESTEYYEDPLNFNSSYITLIRPRQSTLDLSENFSDVAVDFDWKIPSRKTLLSFNYFLTFYDTNSKLVVSEYIKELENNRESFSKVISGDNIVRLDIYIRTVDAFDRIIDTFFCKKNVDDDLITQPITVIEKNPVF